VTKAGRGIFYEEEGEVLMLCRRVLLCSALAAVLVLPAHTGRADALDQIKSRGTMVVAIDPTFPPFEYTDSAGKVIGYDPELIELIAADMGVEVEYQVMAFSGIIPGLIAGSFDFTPTLNVTAERAQRIDYTMPTSASINAVLKLKGDAEVTSDINDLAGLTCAVKQTTQPEQMMNAYNEQLSAEGKTPVKLLGFDTIEQTIAALAADRVDCVVDDKGVLLEAIKQRPDLPLELAGEIGEATFIGWGVNKANPELTAALTEGLKKLKASGKLAELQMKHFGYTTELPEEGFIPSE
jgi:polar amino acid transport system substrate-binding protein